MNQQEGPDSGRHETELEKLDRNWDELLQELRVVQTGVQVLGGFLVTLPFQQRFGETEDLDRRVYLAAFCLTVVATAFLVAPVASHRLLFRKHEKASLVAIAHVCARVGLVALALAVSAVAFVIFDVVVSTGAAVTAAAAILVLFLVNWLLLPLGVLRHDRAVAGRDQAPEGGGS
jgi:predicted neutral ceramidase superfamily lipid hydrolase